MSRIQEEEINSLNKSEIKRCQVCGDLALSYNFNALTCESCKAFFRRNAFKDKLKCSFNDNCSINRITRKFCQKCRLQKCFDVGMQKHLIMTELQKTLKKQKILANRIKGISKPCNKKMSLSSENPKFELSSTNKLVTASSQTQIFMVDSCVQTEFLSPCCQHCNYQSSPAPTDISAEVVESREEIQEDKLDNNKWKKLLDDLIIANSALEAPLESEPMVLVSQQSQPAIHEDEYKQSSLLDVINLTAIAIRRLIKMCKRISEFRALCTEDQVSLLKHGCTQMMLLRSVLNFDPDKNSWKIPHTVNQSSRIKVEVLKEAQGNLYEAHEAFLNTFDPRVSRDKHLICILTAIELFDPTRPNLVRSDLVQQQQECYYNLLKFYLEKEFGLEESVSIFHHLLDKMKQLNRLCEDHIRVYLNVNPSQVEPLLIEIFDLKPH